MNNKSVTIHVPATSANLGPGFDCLALALDMWNHTTFTVKEKGFSLQITGEGSEQLDTDKNNLVARSAVNFYSSFNIPEPTGLNIQCENNIPLGSGLGSSAAAVITGLLGANALSGNIASPAEILNLANEIEGHPDNVCAALFGGLSIVINDKGKLIHHKIDIPDIETIVAVPEFDLSTEASRSAIPKVVPLTDVVFNLGRTALVVEGLRTNNLDLLIPALEDRLHQPYRIKLLPGASKAMKEAIDQGAKAVALSGAGPSIIAFASDNAKNIADIMIAAYQSEGISARPFILSTINRGAYVEHL